MEPSDRCRMGCTVTKVTPTESLHLENIPGETDSISTEETDSHPGIYI